jgi:hypothetical protein
MASECLSPLCPIMARAAVTADILGLKMLIVTAPTSVLGGFGMRLRRWMPVPRQQLGKFLHGMLGYSGKHIRERGLRANMVHLGGHDQAIPDCRPASATIGASE